MIDYNIYFRESYIFKIIDSPNCVYCILILICFLEIFESGTIYFLAIVIQDVSGITFCGACIPRSSEIKISCLDNESNNGISCRIFSATQISLTNLIKNK